MARPKSVPQTRSFENGPDLVARSVASLVGCDAFPKADAYDHTQHVFDLVREAAAIAYFASEFTDRAQLQLGPGEQDYLRCAMRVVAEKLAVAVHNEYSRPAPVG